jgi:DNA-binding response OmpR family regulator
LDTLNILILDDEKVITDKLCQALTQKKYNVFGAYLPNQAIKIIEE